MIRVSFLVLLCILLLASWPAPAGAASLPGGKGVNYLTGEGMDRLNCDAANTAQIAEDMAVIKTTGASWVRIETAMTAITGLPKPPTCPRPAHPFDNLLNLTTAVTGIGAEPIVDILGWHFTPAMAAGYRTWLEALLAAAPAVSVFEIGNEENLTTKSESYPGANPNEEPYGWHFSNSDFAADDGVGVCPKNAAKAANLAAAVRSYVAWLKLSYDTIKAARSGATVILGGLSSWQPVCWLTKLGQLGAYNDADAIGYHPYPRFNTTPEDGAGTVDDLTTAMAGWQKALPIWVTEFGFTTNAAYGGASVASEAIKAQYTAAEFTLLRQKLAGPLLVYTARDFPLTTAEWAADCPGTSCPGGMGGAGLFEWRDGILTVEPAAAALAVVGP